MKRLTLVVLVLASSIFILLTGCSGDDGPDTSPWRSVVTNINGNTGGTNTTANAPATLPATSSLTLTPGNGSGPFQVALNQGSYVLSLPASVEPEQGTFVYAPTGDTATLVLTAQPGGVTRTLNLVFATSTQGVYTSDSLGSGTFTL